jgi:hypothetical protein
VGAIRGPLAGAVETEDDWTRKRRKTMTKTHYCPKGHECENLAAQSGYPKIYCPTCPGSWQSDADLLQAGGSVETDGQRVKLYDVYAYPVGVVKTPNVLAASPQAAIEAVDERVAWRECFASDGDGKNVEFVDFAESFESFQVCEKGQDETSHLFLEDGVTRVNVGPLMALARFLAIAPEMCLLLGRLARSRDDADLELVQQMLKGLLQDIAPQLLEKDQDSE